MSPSSQPSSPLLSRFLPHKPSSPSSPSSRQVLPQEPSSPISHTRQSSTSSAVPDKVPTLVPFTLPLLPEARTSSSSLLEAVVGHSEARSLGQKEPAPPPIQTANTFKSSPLLQEAENTGRTSQSSQSHDDSWDVLSEVSMNTEGSRGEEVAELQKKVEKRKSHLPHLESQLKALEAKIKQAEERLAKAQVLPGEKRSGSA